MIHIAIHPSQFPDQVHADLRACLRAREIRHKFHYESYKQAQKWAEVHAAHSPAHSDPECLATYERAFDWLANRSAGTHVHVVGLGCGEGRKDAVFLERLKAAGGTTHYAAVDVSMPLVVTAQQRAAAFAKSTAGMVCDLERADNLREVLREREPAHHVFTFFGMMPNSEPDVILPRLGKLVSRGDDVALSANLAPGPDYLQGVKRVLPQYDNAETAAWLLTLFYDLGVERSDGRINFRIEECSGLLRIRADFEFARSRQLKMGGDTIDFAAGERVRLFYSYRYTVELLKSALAKWELLITEQWVTPSGEEGVFIVTKR